MCSPHSIAERLVRVRHNKLGVMLSQRIKYKLIVLLQDTADTQHWG